MKAEDLVGSFDLVSWTRADGGEPFGGASVGFLHYGADGTMSAHVMKSDRQPLGFPPRELRKARQVLLKPWTLPFHLDLMKAVGRYLNASANYVAYAGTFEVKGDQVIHHVQISLIPDWVGTDLVRRAKLDGDLLTLSLPEDEDLVWRRRREHGA